MDLELTHLAATSGNDKAVDGSTQTTNMLGLRLNASVLTNFTNSSERLDRCTTVRSDGEPARIGQIMACLVIVLLAMAGNIFVVSLVCRKREMQRTINMFIANMSLSDCLVITSGMSVVLHDLIARQRNWEIGGLLGTITCKLATFLPNTAHLVSLMTLLLISIERYRVVINPTSATPITPRLRTLLLIASWILPTALTAFYLVYSHTRILNNQLYCVIDVRNPAGSGYALFILVLSVALLVVLLIVNLSILRRLRQARVANSLPATQRRSRERRVKNAVAMVLCSVLFYVLLWTPQRIAYMLLVGGYADMFEKLCSDEFKNLGFVLDFLVYLNPTCSPLIYFAFLQDFRNGLKRALGCSVAEIDSTTINATQMDERVR